MPQLMPLFWVISMFMVMLLLMMKVDFFFWLNEKGFIMKESVMFCSDMAKYKW